MLAGLAGDAFTVADVVGFVEPCRRDRARPESTPESTQVAFLKDFAGADLGLGLQLFHRFCGQNFWFRGAAPETPLKGHPPLRIPMRYLFSSLAIWL